MFTAITTKELGIERQNKEELGITVWVLLIYIMYSNYLLV